MDRDQLAELMMLMEPPSREHMMQAGPSPMQNRGPSGGMPMNEQFPYPDDAGTDLAIENQDFVNRTGEGGAFAQGVGNGLMFGIPTMQNPDLFARLRNRHGGNLNVGNVVGAAPWAVVHPLMAGAALGGAVMASEVPTDGAMAAEEERLRRRRGRR